MQENECVNIYIIGSVKYMKDIEMCAEYYNMIGFNVTHVKPEPDRDLGSLIEEGYRNIDNAYFVVVVTKPDDTIGEGTLYEKKFAEYQNKLVIMVDNDHKKKIIRRMEEMK